MKRAALAGSVVALAGLALADAPGEPPALPPVRLTVPAGWTVKTLKPNNKGWPSEKLTVQTDQGPVEMTVQTVPLSHGKPITDDDVSAVVGNSRAKSLEKAVETDVTLEPVDGPFRGLRYTFTRKDLTGPDGKRRCQTVLFLRSSAVAISVNVWHPKDAPELTTAIDAVRNAVYGPATRPAS